MSQRMTRLGALLATLPAAVLSPSAALAEWGLNMPEGATELSREIYGLHMLIFGWCVFIAVVVFGAMIWSIIHHRKSRNPEPAKFHHNTKVEIIWTTIPFLILVIMAAPSAETLIKIEDTRDAELSVKVTGYQWRWQYDYLGHDVSFFSSLAEDSNEARQRNSGIDPNSVDNYLLEVDERMIVPVGKKVRVLLTSNDVIHAWWVPDLGGKKDAIPGFVNQWWFKAEEPGVYRGQCAELCGRDHGFMPVVVEAVPQEDFDAWVAEKEEAAAREAELAAADRDWGLDELMERGEQAYNANCAACHQANGQGLPAAGFPSLVGTAMSTESEQVDEHIDIVLNGRQGTAMQAFGGQLNDLDIAAIITYERNAWGNETGDIVQPRDIEAAR